MIRQRARIASCRPQIRFPPSSFSQIDREVDLTAEASGVKDGQCACYGRSLLKVLRTQNRRTRFDRFWLLDDEQVFASGVIQTGQTR